MVPDNEFITDSPNKLWRLQL